MRGCCANADRKDSGLGDECGGVWSCSPDRPWDSVNSLMGHSCGALEEQDAQSRGQQKSFSLGTWAKDHSCYILEKNLAISHKYLEHQSEAALKDNGLICLTKILKQHSIQAMAWLLLIALFQIHSGSKQKKNSMCSLVRKGLQV